MAFFTEASHINIRSMLNLRRWFPLVRENSFPSSSGKANAEASYASEKFCHSSDRVHWLFVYALLDSH
jgi:hypothetical protein